MVKGDEMKAQREEEDEKEKPEEPELAQIGAEVVVIVVALELVDAEEMMTVETATWHEIAVYFSLFNERLLKALQFEPRIWYSKVPHSFGGNEGLRRIA